MPPRPPRQARMRLSVSKRRMRRKPGAPSAKRTAISRVRARARLRSRPATLVQLGVDCSASCAIEVWIFQLKILSEHGEFIAGLLQCDAGFQARLDFQFAVVAVLEEILLRVG